MGAIHLGIDVAVGYEQVQVAIEVHVEKARTPAEVAHRRGGQAALARGVDKGSAARVQVERVGLAVEVGHIQV